MFWKRKLQVLAVWIVLSAISVAVVYRLPAVYEAKATILVDSQKIPDKFVTSTVSAEIEDRLASLKKEILSGTELLRIVNQLNLYRDQRKNTPDEEIIDMMTKDTMVTLERGWTKDRPGAFSVSYQGSDPRTVAEVANQIADLFINKNLLNREERARGTTQFLESKLIEAQKSLADQEAKVTKYKQKYNGELPEQEASLGGTLSRLQLQLQGNQDAINRAQQNKIMLENSISSTESSIASLVAMTQQLAPAHPASGTSSAASQQSQKESDALQAKLDVLLVHYGEDYPEIKRLRAEIEQLRESESKAAAERPAKGGTQPSDAGTELAMAPADKPAFAQELVQERERLASLKAQLALANRELENRSLERQGVLQNIRVYEARLADLPVRQQDMAGLTRDYEISKDNYRSLLDKKISAEMASDMEKQQEGEKFRLLESARVPEIPVKPKRPLLITAGCVLGLLISLATAAGRELKHGAVLGEWELPSDVAILGRVPWIEIRLDRSGPSDGGSSGKWLKRGWRLALVSSALISLACGIAAVYLGWIKV